MSGDLLVYDPITIIGDHKTNEKRFKQQIDDLYIALDKDDIIAANFMIGSISDSRNLLAEEPLTILLEYPDESIRGNCALALGKLGDKAATRPLIKALNDPSVNVQKKVAFALGNLWDVEVLSPPENKIIPVEMGRDKIKNKKILFILQALLVIFALITTYIGVFVLFGILFPSAR